MSESLDFATYKNYQKAIEYGNKELESAINEQNLETQIWLLFQMARWSSKLHKYNNSIDYYNQAVQYLGRIPPAEGLKFKRTYSSDIKKYMESQSMILKQIQKNDLFIEIIKKSNAYYHYSYLMQYGNLVLQRLDKYTDYHVIYESQFFDDHKNIIRKVFYNKHNGNRIKEDMR